MRRDKQCTVPAEGLIEVANELARRKPKKRLECCGKYVSLGFYQMTSLSVFFWYISAPSSFPEAQAHLQAQLSGDEAGGLSTVTKGPQYLSEVRFLNRNKNATRSKGHRYKEQGRY